MKASVSAPSKSQRLPVRTGQGVQIRTLWPSAVLDEIDQWAAGQADKLSRSDAILRLVQQALAHAADKQPEIRPRSLTDTLRAANVTSAAGTPIAARPPPESDVDRIRAETSQTTRDLKWKPRLVGAVHLPPPLSKARASKPVEGNKLYQMPEDITAFNEYWKLAELMVGRRVEYEEVIGAYNSYRQRIRRRPALLFTDIE